MNATYDPIIFGKRLKKLRKAHHMTQQELADYLVVSVDSVSGYENGRITLAHEYITKLCCRFNVSADYFYFGIEKTAKQEPEGVCVELNRLLSTKTEQEKEYVFNIIKMVFEMKTV